MGRGLRRAGIACAVLLALAAILLFSRLDSDALLARLTAQARDAGMTLTTTGASFSPMNGLSLRLDGLTLSGHGMHIKSRAAFISSSWRALLSGDFVPDTLFLNTANIALEGLPAPSAMLSHLPPLARLNISKSTLTLQNIGLKLVDLQLDIRDLAPDHDMRWELLARADGEPLTSHGQAHLHGHQFETAFAKLKMEHIPLASLIIPAKLPQTPFTHANSTLTIDLAADGQWNAFGELQLLTSADDDKPLILRSKLQGGRDTWLAWKDSYIHFGGQNVVKTAGACRTSRDCSGNFSGSNIALQSVLRLLGSHGLAASSGNVDISGSLAWHDQVLSGNISGAWRKLLWGRGQIPLPAASWRLPQFSYSPGSELQLAQFTISPANDAGNVELSHFLRDASGTHYTLRINDSTTLWQPLANIALAYEKLPSKVQGKGPISASITGDHTPDRAHLRFEIDAANSELQYGELWSKPARISASLRGEWQRQSGSTATTIALHNSELAGSRIADLVWQRDRQDNALQLQGIAIDFTALATAGIRLPTLLPKLAGAIHGDIAGRWQQEKEITPQWSSLNGKLRLHAFNWHGNTWDGTVAVQQGILSTRALSWQRDTTQALMHGRIDLTSSRGELHLDKALMDERSLPVAVALPLQLNGTIKRMQYRMADNTAIRNIRGRYSLDAKGLTLQQAEGQLAGGTLRSDALTLRSDNGELHLAARLHIDRIQLSGIEQWPAWLQARPFGRCFGNLSIEGPLSTNRWPEWRGNGDIAIFSGGWIPLVQRDESGTARALPGEPKRFHRAELRFKLQQDGVLFPRLRIENNNQTLLGSGTMTHQGLMKLTLKNETRKGAARQVEGTWPNIDLPLE